MQHWAGIGQSVLFFFHSVHVKTTFTKEPFWACVEHGTSLK